MKKLEDPGKVVIVHHPPQPDAPKPKSQSSEESSTVEVDPETEVGEEDPSRKKTISQTK